jgi:hypothetical protein
MEKATLLQSLAHRTALHGTFQIIQTVVIIYLSAVTDFTAVSMKCLKSHVNKPDSGHEIAYPGLNPSWGLGKIKPGLT